MNSTDFYDADLDFDPEELRDPDQPSPLQSLFNEFEANHQNSRNVRVQWIGLPMFFVGLIGMVWAIPVPAEVAEYGTWLNFGSLFVLVWAASYFRLSVVLGVGMILVGALLLLVIDSIHKFDPGLVWKVSLAMLIASIVALLLGQRIEGSRMSFPERLHAMFIGPLWLLSHAYRLAQIPYDDNV